MKPTPGQTGSDPQRLVQAAIEAHRDQPGALLPLLHCIQDGLGHVPGFAVALIADALNLSRAEVHGVITYYHHFRAEPAVGPVIQICRAEACQACGSDALWDHARQVTQGERVTLEPVYCLGLCATGPSMTMADRLHARVSVARFDRLLAQLKEAA